MLKTKIGTLFLVFCFLSLVSVLVSACDNWRSVMPTTPSVSNADNKGQTLNPVAEVKETVGQVFDLSVNNPTSINGIELTMINGWLANIYPWHYNPNESTVHPVPRLWPVNQKPNISEQCRQIKEYGGGAVILQYNPNPREDNHFFWRSNGFASDCGPFFVAYEHINGTRFIPPKEGPKNMSDLHNRIIFREDIDFIFRNVVLPNQSRYVTINQRAVIYLWSSIQMEGDFASLLEEIKKDYPVSFIGSESIGGNPRNGDHLARIKVLDGFMEYGIGVSNSYLRTVKNYQNASYDWRRFLRNLEFETRKKYLFIPTFQAAYDDTKVFGRSNPAMYPSSKEEVEYHVQTIRSSMPFVYDRIGPFVVYGELPEGAAVIESRCTSETMNRPGRWTGCGTGRLEILKKFFGGGL